MRAKSVISRIRATDVCLLLLLLLLLGLQSANGKVPDAEIFINDMDLVESSGEGNDSFYLEGAYGLFTSQDTTVSGILRLPPSNDPLLCGSLFTYNASSASSFNPNNEDIIILVPRGECSFEGKTLRAQYLGAKAILIYNTLASRYHWNQTSNSTLYPKQKLDYECENGQTTIDSPTLFTLDTDPYNASIHDSYLKLDSPNNLCLIDQTKCSSNRCLVTQETAPQVYTACCAWDIHITMTGDNTLPHSPHDSTVAVFLTMEQGDQLTSQFINSFVRIQPKWYPKYNASTFYLWLLAVIIAAFASWYSARDYRRARYKLTHPQPREATTTHPPNQSTQSPPVQSIEMSPQSNATDVENGLAEADTNEQEQVETNNHQEPSDQNQAEDQPEQHHQESALNSSTADGTQPLESNSTPEEATQQGSNNSGNTNTRRHRRRRRRNNSNTNRAMQYNNPVTELKIWHAVLFVLMASCFLLLLYYLQFYTFVSALYGIGCSGALSQVLFRPLYSLFSRFTKVNCSTLLCPKIKCCGFEEISRLDIASTVSGYIVGITWLYVYFSSMYPATNPFYWVTQDLMGACIAILFLYLMKLNSIKVATVLMIAIFFYDIFFVFISPLLFDGDSVMITVATSGGPGDVTEDYCMKYPHDAECWKGQPLPMVLTVPKINDFRRSLSLLGLGDVVLPGLLIAFAARLDEAKRLVRDHTNLDIMASPKGGYAVYLVVAYAIGLLFASLAVVWMQRGQPALLYVVPACLGSLFWFGRKEIGELWQGPRVIAWADRLVSYCDSHTFVARDAATVAESEDDEDDDASFDDVAGDRGVEGGASPAAAPSTMEFT